MKIYSCNSSKNQSQQDTTWQHDLFQHYMSLINIDNYTPQICHFEPLHLGTKLCTVATVPNLMDDLHAENAVWSARCRLVWVHLHLFDLTTSLLHKLLWESGSPVDLDIIATLD